MPNETPNTRIEVWDAPTRLFHWSVVILIFISWLSADQGYMKVHLASGLTLLVLLVSVPVFFLSMWRLHRQMTEAKTRYIEEARRLYAAAYAPVRANPTVDALNEQSRALSAAQALEERAHKVLEWPISEGVTAVIAVIFVGVVTSLIVRVIFIAAGY